MDLIGAVIQTRRARLPIHPLQRQVGGVAKRAAGLDGAVDHVVEHLRPEELDQRDLLARGLLPVLVHHPGRVQRHQTRGLHLGRGVRDPVLHGLLGRQRSAERVPLQRALAHDVEGAAGLAQPAHAVVDAAGAQPVLGDLEALADLADQIRLGHAHVAVVDLGVTETEVLVAAHHRYVAHHIDARCVARHQDHRSALVGRRVGVGDHHHDQDRGHHAVAGEPLVPIDDPLVTVQHGGRRHVHGVGARVLGLGHREGGEDLLVEQRVEPLPLLLLGAKERQHLRVAGVGGVVAEDDRPPERGALDLVHEPELDLAHALAAHLGRQMGGPQPPLLDLVLERAHDAESALAIHVVDRHLQRPDLFAHEGAHPRQLFFEFGLGLEVPGHAFAYLPSLIPTGECLRR